MLVLGNDLSGNLGLIVNHVNLKFIQKTIIFNGIALVKTWFLGFTLPEIQKEKDVFRKELLTIIIH